MNSLDVIYIRNFIRCFNLAWWWLSVLKPKHVALELNNNRITQNRVVIGFLYPCNFARAFSPSPSLCLQILPHLWLQNRRTEDRIRLCFSAPVFQCTNVSVPHCFSSPLFQFPNVSVPQRFSAQRSSAPLFQCPNVSVPHCFSAPMFQCPIVPVPHCSSAPLFQCPSVSLPHCSSAPLFQCPNVSVPQCFSAPLFQCPNFSVPHCFSAPMFQWSIVPVPHCSSAPLFQCPNVSVPHCFSAPLFQCPIFSVPHCFSAPMFHCKLNSIVKNTVPTFWFLSLLQTICDLRRQILSTWRTANSTFHVITKVVWEWWDVIKVQKELSLQTSQVPKICCPKTLGAVLKFWTNFLRQGFCQLTAIKLG